MLSEWHVAVKKRAQEAESARQAEADLRERETGEEQRTVPAPVVRRVVHTESASAGFSERWDYRLAAEDGLRRLCAAIGRGDISVEAVDINRSFIRATMNEGVKLSGEPIPIPGIEFFRTTGVSIA